MPPFTDALIALAATPSGALPSAAMVRARYSMLDWLVCGRAALAEPITAKLRQFALAEAGAQQATLFGGGRVPSRMAALVNGGISHALDYDDTHFAHVGHLSVGIYPAAMAVSEAQGDRVEDLVAAFLVGAEGAIRVGMMLGAQHYNHGFHQTATAGAFGAALAAGRLMCLGPDQMRAALGLCATRASGLKAQFGTMGKPYNAGVAAANGVECAQLAALGMTSATDGLMGPQGFAQTHHAALDAEAAWRVPPSDRFFFEDNLYKLHACCHGLHAMIEGLRGQGPLGAVARLSIRTNPRWLRVCDIKAPRTGLEVKFSYAWLAGMTLRGDATGDPGAYSDAVAQDLDLQAFAQTVSVVGDPALNDLQAAGEITLRDGATHPWSHDLSQPVPDLQKRLETKARQTLGDEGARIWALLPEVPQMTAAELAELLA